MLKKNKNKIAARSHKTKYAKAYKASIKRARPKHKRIMLHPASMMILVCVGVLIANMGLSSNADNLVVTAVVHAPSLTEGATITSPVSNEVETTSPIEISGSCPDNSYVNLTLNGNFAGSAACVSQTFSIEASLSKGTNDLLAQDYNITNDPGPVTPDVFITYSPPVPPTPVPPSQIAQLSSSATPTAVSYPNSAVTNPNLPLLLSSSYLFKTFLAGSNFSWLLNLDGGTPPYVVVVNWGDSTSTTYNFKADPTFTISHNYAKSGYYPVVIRAIDAKGHQNYLQLAALIHTSNNRGFAGITEKGTTPPKSSISSKVVTLLHDHIWVVWPAYAFVLLLVFSFWLGEREEYMHLMKLRKARKRHNYRPRY